MAKTKAEKPKPPGRWHRFVNTKTGAIVLAAIVVLVILFATSGCAQIDPYRSAAIDQVAHVSDRALEDAELVMCRGITVGSWVRAYGNDKERADAWKVLCSPRLNQTP